jgi:hypothetical protein
MLTEHTLEDRCRRSRRRFLWYGVVLITVVASVLEWWQGHPAILAPAAAVIAVAMPASRRLPVPAASAAALLLVVGFYLAAVLALGMTAISAPMRPSIALGVLLAPCLGVVVDLALVRRSEPWRGASTRSWTERIAVVGAVAGSALFLLVLCVAIARYGEGALAFVLRGDARNHVLVARQILSGGGMDGVMLSQGPTLSNSVLALMMASRGMGFAPPDQILRNEFDAVAALVTLATIAWSLSSAGLVWAVGGLRHRAQALALAAASLIPLTGLGLGVALSSGFFSIVFAMPLLISALSLAVWTVRTRDRRRGSMLSWVAMSMILPVAATTWTPMLPVETMVVAGAIIGFHRRSMVQETLKAVGIAGVAMVAAVLLVLPLLTGPALAAVTATGWIFPPPPAVFLTVPLIVLAIAVAGLPQVRRSVFLPYLLGTLAAGAVVTYAVAQQPPGLEWNYYPAKLAWIWVLVGFPLLLTPAAFVVPLRSTTAWGRRVLPTTIAAAASIAVLGLAATSVRVSSPLLPQAAAALAPGAQPGGTTLLILNGWQGPDWRTVDAVLALVAKKQSLVMWNYFDPGNDRLGNFWLSTYDPLLSPDSGAMFAQFSNWAGAEDGVDVNQLCDLLNRDPLRIVATRNSLLPSVVTSRCGLPADRVWVAPQ